MLNVKDAVIEILLVVGLSFALTAFFGRLLIPVLRALHAGQSIKEIGPKWHMSKQGTPTMGGLMFITAMGLVTLVLGWSHISSGNRGGLYVYLFALVFGAIGFIDDYMKVVHHENTGLTAGKKFLLQLSAAILMTVLLRSEGYLSPNLYIPFVQTTIPLSWTVYMAFAAFVMVGCVNAVNITDGVDGLSSSVTVPVALFFTVVAALWGRGELVTVSCALLGGLLGFLLYNHYPAQVFMGDTGSLCLGGMVCGLAFALDMPLVLIPVGIVYIAETMSDILQVSYFKLTRKLTGTGKRLFKMAPLHHHFEMCGWKEKKVVGVFATVSALFCIIAYFGVRQRYGL